MRRTRALPLIALVLAAAGCRKPPPPLELPTADQIAEIRASAPQIEFVGSGSIPEFVVPPEHVPKILFWLAPAEPAEPSLAQGAERGTYFHVADILIRTKDGRELRLRCHDVGKNPVAFTPNCKDYYWGRSKDEQVRGFDGGVQLYVAVEKAYEASRAKKAGP